MTILLRKNAIVVNVDFGNPRVFKNRMSEIVTGDGSALTSSTIEGYLLELASYIKEKEAVIANNPNSANNVQVSFNLQSLEAVISYQLPAAPGISATGDVITTAENYLQNTGFSNGTGGSLKSGTPERSLIEAVTLLQIYEADIAKNPSESNRVTSTYDSDERIFEGEATLPITFTRNTDGSIQVVAEEYLLD